MTRGRIDKANKYKLQIFETTWHHFGGRNKCETDLNCHQFKLLQNSTFSTYLCPLRKCIKFCTFFLKNYYHNYINWLYLMIWLKFEIQNCLWNYSYMFVELWYINLGYSQFNTFWTLQHVCIHAEFSLLLLV